MGTHPIFESDFDCLTERAGERQTLYSLGSSDRMTTHGELIDRWKNRCYIRLNSLNSQRNRSFSANGYEFIKAALHLFLSKFDDHFSVEECEALISSLEGSNRDTCFVVREGELYQINDLHCELKQFYEVHFGCFLAKLFNERLTDVDSPHMIERSCQLKDGNGCINPQHYQFKSEQRQYSDTMLQMSGENFTVMDQHEFISSVHPSSIDEINRISASFQQPMQPPPPVQRQIQQQQQQAPVEIQQQQTSSSMVMPGSGETDEKPSIEEINKQTIENFRSRVTTQRFWCKIAYHELQDRVGETWEAPSEIESIVIDGYANPFDGAPNRFSLGLITNINRRPEADRTRRFIGRGISLLYEDGCLWLLNESDSAVFIQSPICNITKNWHPATVVKVVSQSNIKLFERERFEDVLCAKFRSGYEETYNLVYVCKIRMSFVKGWGAAYSRATVSQCPCWIEISLNEPLAWLDAALRELKPIDHLNSIS